MNASQFLAWILCLALALFASALAARNGYKTALLEKEFASVQRTAEDQQQVLQEIRDVLRSIDRRLGAAEAPGERTRTELMPGPVGRRVPTGKAQ
jgi:hypothetical protein